MCLKNCDFEVAIFFKIDFFIFDAVISGLPGVGLKRGRPRFDPAGVATPVDPAGVGAKIYFRGRDPAGAGVENIFPGHEPGGV